MDTYANRTRLEKTLHEEILFAPHLPTVECINSKKILVDAVKRGLQMFNLANFIDPTKWSKLTHLYLARNQLVYLPDELFHEADNLEWLDVRWNELQRFPTSVKDHSCLRTVLLQDNNLAILPIELGSLEKLQSLCISNNPLEFPSPDTLSECRSNGDLINYLRLCWKEQSTDVLPPRRKDKFKRKRVPKKLGPLCKVKDHTEVICRLRNSGKIKDQIKAERMLQRLEFEHKLEQSFKDQDVLKKWRDTYKESQGNISNNDIRFPNTFSHLFSKNEPLKVDQQSHYYFTRDIESTIAELQKQLKQSNLSQTSTMVEGADPQHTLREKSREIDHIRDIQKKITYLKQRNEMDVGRYPASILQTKKWEYSKDNCKHNKVGRHYETQK